MTRPKKESEYMRINLSIPKELYGKLQKLSVKKGQSISALLRLGVMEYFKLELGEEDIK